MSNLKTKYQADYSGGLNDTNSPWEIEDNEASLLRNWDITFQARLKRRDGLTLVGNAISANPISGLSPFIRNAGNDLLATESTNLWYLNGSTWAKIADNLTNTAGLLFWMENIQVLGKIFIGNEDNTIRTWDRVATTLNTCITDLGATIPHGNVRRWFQNYMLEMNNVNVSGTKYPNRLYISALGDPTTYTTATDYIDVPGEGRLITAVQGGSTTTSDTLVLFKERSIQVLTGYGISSWKITTSNNSTFGVDSNIGCIAPRGVVRVNGDIWFIDSQAQVRKLTRSIYGTFTDGGVVSTKIRGTLAGLNQTQLALTQSWYHANKVYFAFPNASDTTNSIVCVFDLITSLRTQAEAWTTYTGWTPSIFCGSLTSGVPALYMGDATTGKVYKHTGLDDNGVAIDARWDGKEDFYGVPERWKRYKFGYIRGLAGSGTQNVDIYASITASPQLKIGTLVLMSGGSTLGPTGTFKLGPTGTNTLAGATEVETKYFFAAGGGNPQGKSIKIGLRHKVVGQQPIVGTFSNHYKEKQLR